MLIRSIKHAAVLMFVSFTLGLTLLYLALAVVAAFIVEDALIYRLLAREAAQIEHQYRQTGVLVESGLDFIQVYAKKSALPTFAQQALADGITDNEIFTSTKEHYHIKTLRLKQGKTGYLLAEVSPLLIVTNTPRIFTVFLFGLGITLVIGIFLAFKMASFTVRPVMAMTNAVKNKQPLPHLKHELGYLSDTLQNAFDEQSRSLQREKDFTTDVSHELRTPLTVLNNTITLAEQRGFQPEDIVQLRDAGRQMQHTVEVLLSLARAESVAKQTCQLRPMIEQVGMTCALSQGIELDLSLEVADDFVVDADPSLLTLLLTNLINNAISHGSDNQLTIEANENQLLFHNATSSLAEHETNSDQTDSGGKSLLTERGIKGEQSQGIGQGLYLVTRILDALEWRYQLHHGKGQFSIDISL
ncbi:HAMP domain-containing sensor histidine kinase [Corallincola platygyrae]|uniref:histidine kinase n=1 Tax=Corallincola platygyrae TaxID=1193278 RepID=A0ABW4XQ06_9GAMM